MFMFTRILVVLVAILLATIVTADTVIEQRRADEVRLERRGYFPTLKPIRLILARRDHKRLTKIKEAVYDCRLTPSLVAAIALQETGHLPEQRRDTAVGDGGASVGRYQIQVSTVLDVNAWYGTEFEPKDRKDPHLARIILRLYLHRQYWRIEDQINLGKKAKDLVILTPVQIARIWNGGTGYWNQPATEAYGQAISRWLE